MFTVTSSIISSHYSKAVFSLIFATIILLSIRCDIALAENWESFPFYGGEVLSVAISPDDEDVVYVGTRDAGVFKTINGGQSWQPARHGLTLMPIRTIEIDPQNSNVLYAGSDFDGIWKSTNGGGSWIQIRNGVLNGNYWLVENIVIDFQNTQIIYAAYHQPHYGGHILKSVNGGTSWEYKDSGIPKNEDGHTEDLYALAIDPNNHLTLYTGTRRDGAFRTTNGGESWQTINCGVPVDSNGDLVNVTSFAFDPHHSNRLCSVIGFVGRGYYFFNAQNCWEKISTDNRVDDHIKFHPTDGDIIYSYGNSFHISSDGGVTFGYAEDIEQVNDIEFHNDFPDTIYAATEWYGSKLDGYRSGGVNKTTDSATTWSEMNQGITARVISTVGVDPQNSDYIYAIDGGDNTLLHRSQDGGQTWQRSFDFIGEFDLDFITVDPLMSQQIYAGGWANDFYISTDYGDTFSTIDEVIYPTMIAFDPDSPTTMYVSSREEGIYKSYDSGSTWTQKRNGLPIDSFDGSTWIDSVAVDPNNSLVVWAGANVREGIFKSEDGGENWVLKGLKDDFFAHKILSLAINSNNSNIILAGTGSYGPGSIYRTTNGGATWQKKVTDIAWVYKIIYDPRDSNIVYAATEGSGIIRSTDGGETWHGYSNGIFYPVVYSLEVTNENPPLLLTGSYGSGLYHFREKINVSPLSLKTTEKGETVSFSVVLNDQPTSSVIIGITSSDMTEGTVLPNSLVFNIANWDTPQVVTVTGVDDSLNDGDITYTIITAPAVSVDLEYSGRDADDVWVTNVDNDDQLCFPVKTKSGNLTIICM